MSAIALGYIRNTRADWFWFVLLPPLAVAFALISDRYLTFVALASISLWITVPHHFGTWCRTYGLSEDWKRFRARVIVGPIVIAAAVVLGLIYAPLTVFIVTTLWDHQHSCMQQYGLGRIYDFKGKAGGTYAAKYDLWLIGALYVNHLLTTPLWTEIWLQQLYTWNVAISAESVLLLQQGSYVATGLVVIWYVGGVVHAIRQGVPINPMKYLFLLSSFGLWYFTAWHTNSLLVYGIAHKIMHGLQYLIFVYWFLERKRTGSGSKPWMLPNMSVITFAIAGLVYALIFQLLLLKPMSEFGFGLVPTAVPASEGSGMIQQFRSSAFGYEVYAGTIVNSAALIHYYFDSFIWKVRDERNQAAF